MNNEDNSGSFTDFWKSKGQNMYDDKDSTVSFRSELLNAKDVSYLGPIFLGLPKSQGAMVVYDTGSDWLTVKSCITEMHCNRRVDKEATLKKLMDDAKNANKTGGANSTGKISISA